MTWGCKSHEQLGFDEQTVAVTVTNDTTDDISYWTIRLDTTQDTDLAQEGLWSGRTTAFGPKNNLSNGNGDFEIYKATPAVTARRRRPTAATRDHNKP